MLKTHPLGQNDKRFDRNNNGLYHFHGTIDTLAVAFAHQPQKNSSATILWPTAVIRTMIGSFFVNSLGILFIAKNDKLCVRIIMVRRMVCSFNAWWIQFRSIFSWTTTMSRTQRTIYDRKTLAKMECEEGKARDVCNMAECMTLLSLLNGWMADGSQYIITM